MNPAPAEATVTTDRWRRWLNSMQHVTVPDASSQQLLAEAVACLAVMMSREYVPYDADQAKQLTRAGALTVHVRRRLELGDTSRDTYDARPNWATMSRDALLRETIAALLAEWRSVGSASLPPHSRIDGWPLYRGLRGIETRLLTLWERDNHIGPRDPQGES